MPEWSQCLRIVRGGIGEICGDQGSLKRWKSEYSNSPLGGVNFKAFEITFRRTCVIRMGSPISRCWRISSGKYAALSGLPLDLFVHSSPAVAATGDSISR